MKYLTFLGSMGLMLVSFEIYADFYQFSLNNNTSRALNCSSGIHGKETCIEPGSSQSVSFYSFYVTCQPKIKQDSSEEASNCTFSRAPRINEGPQKIECYWIKTNGQKVMIKATLDSSGGGGQITFDQEKTSAKDKPSPEEKSSEKKTSPKDKPSDDEHSPKNDEDPELTKCEENGI